MTELHPKKKMVVVGWVVVGIIVAVWYWRLPPTSAEGLGKAASRWVPIGASVSAAERTMLYKGFDVTRLPPAKGDDDLRDTLFCSRLGWYFGPIIGREWRVLLTIDHDKIVQVRAFVFLTGP